MSSVWRSSLVPFGAGLLVGGALSGLVLGAAAEVVSPVPPGLRLTAAGVVLVALAVVELAGLGGRMLQNRRLVPQEITGESPELAALQFGIELGSGVRTFVTTAAPLALAVLVVLTGSFPAAVVAGVGFALGRGAMPLARSASADRVVWDDRLERQGRLLGLAGFTALALVLAPGLVAAFRAPGGGVGSS